MNELNELLLTSPDLKAERIEELKLLFPDLVTDEGQLDPDALKQLLDDDAGPTRERYEFTWNGKARAKRHAFTPSRAALTYDPDCSTNPDKADGNLIIEGENLEVMKLLGAAYRERVKCIYIDPPYNTGGDFIYSDDYSQDRKAYWEDSGAYEEGVQLDTNPDSSGRYHSDWLSMMYSRLLVARQLLKDDGVVLVSIDDNEVHNLRKIMNEIFGEGNFIAQITWKNVTDNNPTLINKDHEYILCFGKDINALPRSWKSTYSESKELLLTEYARLKSNGLNIEEIEAGIRQFISDNRELVGHLSRYKHVDEHGVYTGSESVHNTRAGGYDYEILHPTTGKPMRKPANGYRFPQSTYEELLAEGVIIFGEDEKRIIKLKKYLADYEDTLRSVLVLDGRLGSYDIRRVFGKKVFDNPKPVQLLTKLISYVTDDGDIILDPFAGSGVVPEAVVELNQKFGKNSRFIAIQLPEKIEPNTDGAKNAIKMGFKKISEITIARARRVICGYGDNPEPMDTGFKVYRLTKSHFPRVEFQPDPDKTARENVELLQQYISEKESGFQITFDQDKVFDEVLLKHGFMLDYSLTEVGEIEENTVYVADDGTRQAIICLDIAISDATVDYFKEHTDKPFICLERALDTTKKWNLKHFLGDRLKSI